MRRLIARLFARAAASPGGPRPAPAPPRPADPAAFDRDVAALRAEMEAAVGPQDLAHLKKMERWGRLCSILGYGTAWIAPNPLSAALIAHGNTTRWAIAMHHIGHRAYERVPGLPERYRASRFAVGLRRYIDWFDWVYPEAWRFEHNAVHHVRTGDPGDPDLVQRNTDWLRRSSMPRALKYAFVGFYACTWKLVYYAPNTFQIWRGHLRRGEGEPADPRLDAVRYLAPFSPLTAEGRAFWRMCVLPYAAARFVVAPALFAPLGPWAVASVLLNSAGAEILANIESFILITPNHAGDDIPCFAGRPESRAERSFRQIAGTVNYATSGDFVAFLHGWTNYHIEHHLFPDLPLLKYREYQGRLRQLCETHGIAYRQEGVLRRALKAAAIMTGEATMAGPA
jgi:fatty acid desaturase